MSEPKVVLVTPPQEWTTKEYLPPIGLAYIASVLEDSGYEVEVIDSPPYGYTAEGTVKKIIARNPDAVGITSLTHNRYHAIRISELLKKEMEVPIFVGGPHFSTTASDALRNVKSIDIVVRGEGELTTKEFLDTYFKGGDLKKVLGITFRDNNGRIIETPNRPFIRNLDELPMPAWHLFPIDKYKATLEGEHETPCLSVMSSRGCPYSCVFCVNSTFWGRVFRRRDPKKVVDEIEFLQNQYGYEAFEMCDDTFTLAKKHVKNVCEELLDRKIDIRWFVRARVDTADRELLVLMKKSGCVAIAYGAESGSQTVLDRIKKGIKLDQIRKAVKISAELGYYVKVFFMFSHPNETIEDLRKTLKFMDELSGYGLKVSTVGGFTEIYPGTELELLAKEIGSLPRDFSWNTYQIFPKAKLFGGDVFVPPYENPDFPIEEMLRIMKEEWRRPSRLIALGLRKLTSVRDLRSFGKFLIELGKKGFVRNL